MKFKIVSNTEDQHQLHIIDEAGKLSALTSLTDEQRKFATATFKRDQPLAVINQYNRILFIYLLKPKANQWQTNEQYRKAGAGMLQQINAQGIESLLITADTDHSNALLLAAEGMALASYQFLKYHSDAKKKAYTLKTICFVRKTINNKELKQLEIVTDAVYQARDLVNEPLNFLTAEQLSKEFSRMGKEAGFKVTVLNKSRIEKEKMGGILAVNKGSIQPPTFSIMEYKPAKPINKRPLVLVGKGIVYDTGGLSLKPTPESMDRMKSDMSGAALVSSAMYAIARMELPVHIIALVPATENRPGLDAYVPGDVITMYSGTTVEVLNTDAEGRLVLADALHWAKRYQPELVLDFATLTGAAAVAIGEHAIVCMGTAEENVKSKLRDSGFSQYERLVEYPLWEEYGDMIKSDIADLKNIGGRSAGAITAGKFLEHFTDYPWMHFDIAGVSFAQSKKYYTPAGGTGYGLRMLLDFVQQYATK